MGFPGVFLRSLCLQTMGELLYPYIAYRNVHDHSLPEVTQNYRLRWCCLRGSLAMTYTDRGGAFRLDLPNDHPC